MSPPIRDYSDWFGQYVLAEEPVEVPGWTTYSVAGRYLAAHPDLPVAPVTQAGQDAGALLGWPCTDRIVSRLDLPAGTDPVPVVYALGGRWLYVGRDAVYPDPAASQPCVFSAGLRAAASSAGLLPAADDAGLVKAFNVVRRDGWYPFGLTPKLGVRRLLPNHALDLGAFEARRVHAGAEPGTVSVADAVAYAIDAVRAAGAAFAGQRLLIALTAGRASRSLLAALRTELAATDFWTARSDARGNAVDVQVARALARRHGLRHTVVPRVPASASDVRGWLDRVGWARAGARSRSYRTEEAAARGHVLGLGALGQVARAYYARPPGALNAAAVVDCVRAPPRPDVLDAADGWLEGLPSRDPTYVLGLLHLEQRVGAWAAPGVLGSPRAAPTVFLLNRRDAVDAMLGVPAADKASGTFPEEALRQAWPELLALPFDEPVGLARLRVRLRGRLGALRRLLPT